MRDQDFSDPFPAAPFLGGSDHIHGESAMFVVPVRIWQLFF